MVKYNFEGKSYEITITDEWDRNEQREEQILRDFKYLESISDWGLIKLRITNGLWEGWLKHIGEMERIEPTTNDKGFW
jgi:hypothetical protein